MLREAQRQRAERAGNPGHVRPPDAQRAYSLLGADEQADPEVGLIPGVRRRRLQREARRATEESREEERSRQQATFCFVLAFVTLCFTEYDTCGVQKLEGGPPHWFNIKSWMIVYLCLSFTQVFRMQAHKYLDSLFEQQRITYR